MLRRQGKGRAAVKTDRQPRKFDRTREPRVPKARKFATAEDGRRSTKRQAPTTERPTLPKTRTACSVSRERLPPKVSGHRQIAVGQQMRPRPLTAGKTPRRRRNWKASRTPPTARMIAQAGLTYK